MHENIYTADAYLRLSKEDGDKQESDSIANQRALILDFINSQPDIHLNRIRIDDGYSGVDFNRPAFTEMLEDIAAGVVNCVIVKDFSRFGRNYIESGRYIQIIFPRSGIRFIAVNDCYDSSKAQGYTGNIIVPFKNMVNDAYSADISVKVRSHLAIKRKRGDFVGAFAVYGYAKAENDKNKLVIDTFAADVVRDIFRWKLEGHSAQGIADRLNQRGILSPMDYKRFRGLRYSTAFRLNSNAQWQSVTVRRILTNAVYTGVLEQGKRSKPNYKARKCVELSKEYWICVENAHEPVIERNIFETVQELLKKDTRASKKGSAVLLLSGVIVCGDCGAAMVRKNYKKKDSSRDAFYVCSKHRADIRVCTTHTISAAKSETAVLRALRLYAFEALDINKIPANNRQDSVRKLTARLEAKQEEIKRFEDFRLSLYEGCREGVIKKSDFINYKESYDAKIAAAEQAALLLKEELEKLAGVEMVLTHDALDRKAVAELIERVAVYEGGRIEITFRYQNEFSRARGMA